MGRPAILAPLVAGAWLLAAAAIPNLTGTWKLNVEKSDWGDKPKPASGFVTIQHDEPKLSVSGTVAHGGEEAGNFHFEGEVDGKPRGTSDGTVTIRRIDPYTLESVWKSNDGRYEETSRTSVSRDGMELTRRVHLKQPGGELKWTEVYEKQ